jgi:hypothetical protein
MKMNPQSNLTLDEQERVAWVTGDIEKAAVLAQLADDADELQRLRLFYEAVCKAFPVNSKDTKASMLAALQSIWESIEDAGDVGMPD